MRGALPILLVAGATGIATGARAFTVNEFSPSTESPAIRQISVEFSTPMVAFGDPTGGPAPFSANSCQGRGQGRFIDDKHWIFDFLHDLPAGVSCSLTVNPALRGLDGSKLTGKATFAFSSGGPTIMDSDPSSTANEDAAFVLTLNSDYDSAALKKFAYFHVPGVANKVQIDLVTGALREAVLKAHFKYREPPKPEELARTVIVRPLQNLPPGKKVKLVLGAGVATAKGIRRSDPQVWEYEVRSPFTARLDCERENAQADCTPVSGVHLNFSADVPQAYADKVQLVDQAGKPVGKRGERSDHESNVWDVNFDGPLPAKAELELRVPADFKDDTGRTLSNARFFPMKFKTAGYPPLVKFAANFGILEANVKPLLPITVRNVEANVKARRYVPVPRAADKNLLKRWYDRLKGQWFRIPKSDVTDVLAWLDKLARVGREDSVFGPGEKGASFDPKLTLGKDTVRLGDLKLGQKDGKAFEVMGLDLGGPGFYVVETESQILGESLLGKAAPMYVASSALVTNLAVHFKMARNSSLVWVTTLDKGQPVKGALVSIWDCKKNLHFKGKTNDDGFLAVDKELPKLEKLPQCFVKESKERLHAASAYGGGFLVAAELGDDFSFAHTSWEDGIEPWRFNLPYVEAHEDVVLHTVLDRSLLRAGDTVHLKTVLRQRTSDGFGFFKNDAAPKTMILAHEGSEQKYELPLTFDSTGVAVNDWQVPKDAKLGTYMLFANLPGASKKVEEEESNGTVVAGELRVEEFRIPLAKGLINAAAAVLVKPKTLKYDVGVQYLSGGAAANLPVTFRVRMNRQPSVHLADFDGFSFGSEPVVVGENRRDRTEAKEVELYKSDLTLGSTGMGLVSVADVPQHTVPYEVESELEYKDPSGEIQTVSRKQSLWPSRFLVGIKANDWLVTKDKLKFLVAVADKNGKPVSGHPVKVKLFKRRYLTHRKRLIGGFYAYEDVEKVTAVGDLCGGKTGTNGEFTCVGKSKAGGELLAEASSTDKGGVSSASTSVYVPGNDSFSFPQGDQDRIDVVPEKKAYETGETARLQVRMPFKKAFALVTVEREGIQDVFVKELEGKTPVIEVKVKDNYAPNTFISVLVVRGRVKKPEANFLADLARPAFRLGMAAISVGSKAYTLNVKVKTDRKTYQARDEVAVSLEAHGPDGNAVANAEAAVAVIDEGLLQLKPNDSWNLLAAMTGQRGDTAHTFTAAMQVIGKRHFGLKALNPGGGGGVEATRSMFDAMVFWQSRVPLDREGKGQLKFKLNDSLTSFKVVAIAQAGTSRFGTGETSIAATKDVMILPGIPPTARAGDHLKASFTVRNTTKDAKRLEVKLTVVGLKEAPKPQKVELPAGSGLALSWDVAVPPGESQLEYKVLVEAAGKLADQLVIKQKVTAAVPERTVQATLVQLAPETELTVAPPAGAEAGRGGLLVSLRPSLAGDFAGLTDYMRDYPYSCLEQRTSKAIALNDDTAWNETMTALPSYMDSDGLLKYYPTSRDGSAVLTAYLLTIGNEAGRAIPPEYQVRLLQALKGFVDGAIVRDHLSFGADLVLQKLSALDALSRYGEATAEELESFEHTPKYWPTSALIDWIGILKRLPETATSKNELDLALKQLKTRMTYRGTTLTFSTETRDDLWWLMVSADENAVRIPLLALEFKLFADDLPKIVRSALARQGAKGHWDLTTANAFGALALRKFAAARESTKVSGKVLATVGKETKTHDWSSDASGGRLLLPWGAGPAKLKVKQEGDGAPWAQIESRAAVPLTAKVAAGFGITKEVTPLRVKTSGLWSVGDIARVKITVNSQTDTGLVVVDDPIPTGASILGTGLGGNTKPPGADDAQTGYAWPTYRETSFNGLKAYYDTVPKGEFSLEYTFRLNNAGDFKLPPTHVEAMYAPDTYGDSPNPAWKVNG